MAFTEVISLLFRSQGTGKVKRDVKQIEGSMKSAGTAARAMIVPIAGLAATYIFSKAIKSSMEFEKALTQLSIQGHINAQGQENLKNQILETSAATGMSRDSLREYAQGVTDATGNIKLAEDAMLAVAMAAQVTGSDMQGLGTLVSDASMKFNILGKDAGDALEILIEQGELGRYTLAEMSRTGATAMSVAGIAGMEGVDGLREMGAMMQIIRQGFGSAEEAATGFKTMVTKLYGPETERKLAKLGKGISIRGKSGELRKFGDIFLDVLRESKGDAAVLTDIFGTRGILGTANFAKIMKDNGGSVEAVSKELDKYRNVQGGATNLRRKFMRVEKSAAVQTEKFKAEMGKLFDETIATTGNMEALGEAAAGLAATLTATVQGIQWIGKLFGGIADKFGFVMQGGTAKSAAKMTPEEIAARQGIGIVTTHKTGHVLAPEQKAQMDATIAAFKNSPYFKEEGYTKSIGGGQGVQIKTPEAQLSYIASTEGGLEKLAKALSADIKVSITNSASGVDVNVDAQSDKGIKPSTEGI